MTTRHRYLIIVHQTITQMAITTR